MFYLWFYFSLFLVALLLTSLTKVSFWIQLVQSVYLLLHPQNHLDQVTNTIGRSTERLNASVTQQQLRRRLAVWLAVALSLTTLIVSLLLVTSRQRSMAIWGFVCLALMLTISVMLSRRIGGNICIWAIQLVIFAFIIGLCFFSACWAYFTHGLALWGGLSVILGLVTLEDTVARNQSYIISSSLLYVIPLCACTAVIPVTRGQELTTVSEAAMEGYYILNTLLPLHLILLLLHSYISTGRSNLCAMEERAAMLESELHLLQKENDILKSKEGSIATLAHEIRTPLNALLASCTLLRDTELPLEEQRDYVEVMFQCGNQITSNMNHVLEFCKLQDNKVELEYKPFSIQEVFTSAFTMVRSEAYRKGIELRISGTFSLPRLLGDSSRFKEILLNLLMNSIKFTDRGFVELNASITTTTTLANPSIPVGQVVTLRIEIQDSGMGMTFEQQQHLFQRFQQASASTWGQFGGSGLGLVICRQLVGLMGGELYVDSARTAPGQGSCFVVTIPLPLAEPFSFYTQRTHSLRPHMSERSTPTTSSHSNTKFSSGSSRVSGGRGEAICAACMDSVIVAQTSLGSSGVCKSWNDAMTEENMARFNRYQAPNSNQRVETAEVTKRLPQTNSFLPMLSIAPSDIAPCILPPVSCPSLLNDTTYSGISPGDFSEDSGKLLSGSTANASLFEKRVAMVIEDEAVNARLLAKFLHSFGFEEVLIVHGGEEAFTLFTQRLGQIHVIMSDLNFSCEPIKNQSTGITGMDGFQFAALLRSSSLNYSIANKNSGLTPLVGSPNGSHSFVSPLTIHFSFNSNRDSAQSRGDVASVPHNFHGVLLERECNPCEPILVALSGMEGDNIPALCKEAGFHAFLQKPVSRSDLRDCLVYLLQLQHSVTSLLSPQPHTSTLTVGTCTPTAGTTTTTFDSGSSNRTPHSQSTAIEECFPGGAARSWVLSSRTGSKSSGGGSSLSGERVESGSDPSTDVSREQVKKKCQNQGSVKS